MDMDLTIWLHNNPYQNKAEAKPHSDAILQQLLQNTLNTSKTLTIHKNDHGKPFVNEAVYFSHSNCRNLHAYVISTTAEVGVDVEYMRPNHAFQKLADRYFSHDELAAMQPLAAAARRSMFYQLWTLKEAWCKLDGGNLWSYLNRSVLGLAQGQSAVMPDKHIKTTQDIAGYACAVACAQPFNRIWINHLA